MKKLLFTLLLIPLFAIARDDCGIDQVRHCRVKERFDYDDKDMGAGCHAVYDTDEHWTSDNRYFNQDLTFEHHWIDEVRGFEKHHYTWWVTKEHTFRRWHWSLAYLTWIVEEYQLHVSDWVFDNQIAPHLEDID